ncbi:hypothetical protein [uncultured Thomasclavelia sp.]|nr:hypothetical protein [uncultured Thomasclavelia sp.]
MKWNMDGIMRRCPKCGRYMISQIEYTATGYSILVYYCVCGYGEY